MRCSTYVIGGSALLRALLYAGLAGRYVETAKPKLEQRFAWIDAQLAAASQQILSR